MMEIREEWEEEIAKEILSIVEDFEVNPYDVAWSIIELLSNRKDLSKELKEIEELAGEIIWLIDTKGKDEYSAEILGILERIGEILVRIV